MAVPTLNISLPRNGSWTRTLLIADDESGTAKNLTGVTFEMEVKRSAGAPGAALANATVTVVDAPAGEISVELLGSQFAAVEGAQEIVRLAYDLRMVEGSRPTLIMAGYVMLYPGVTT